MSVEWGDRIDDALFAAFALLVHGEQRTLERPLEERQAALALAARHHLDVLVAGALGLPDPLRARHALASSLRAVADQRHLSRALGDVEHMFLKGVLSDALWWGGEGRRGTTDIDVLVRRGDAGTAAGILEALGYQRVLLPGYRATQEAQKERLYALPDRGRYHVDLHAGLLDDPPFRDPADAVLDRAIVHKTVFGPIRGLALEDMLLHAGGNLGQDRFSGRVKLALDAACLLSRRTLDFDVVAARAHAWGVTAPLWGLLRLLEVKLLVPVPRWLMQELAPPPGARGLIERVAGVHAAPLVPRGHARRLLLADWPLSGRALWPLVAVPRWARLRIADRRLARRR